MPGGRLDNRRVLLVEDEYFQAMDAKRWLEDAGAEVIGPAARAEDLPALLGGGVDVAVLDINLGDGASFSAAETLRSRGVPFLFLTGYDCGGIPAGMAGVPCLPKPAQERQIIDAIEALIG